jgi:hypothetical protein
MPNLISARQHQLQILGFCCGLIRFGDQTVNSSFMVNVCLQLLTLLQVPLLLLHEAWKAAL